MTGSHAVNDARRSVRLIRLEFWAGTQTIFDLIPHKHK